MNNQKGFTLIELAIVLVIIGLLLGGVLRGQELINSAKVKNIATDFRNIPVYIYGYQDKFRALPGDDKTASTHVSSDAVNGDGDGQLEGRWNTAAPADETHKFWQQVRLAGFAQGSTDNTLTADFYPKNADGGDIGIEAGRTTTPAIAGLGGTYVICSKGILGKYVKQLDTTSDNGNTATGTMMATPSDTYALGADATATADIVDGTSYVVCMAI
jgi:prepilin-type N-terminal cleavage/methylation domain-containing protein